MLGQDTHKHTHTYSACTDVRFTCTDINSRYITVDPTKVLQYYFPYRPCIYLLILIEKHFFFFNSIVLLLVHLQTKATCIRSPIQTNCYECILLLYVFNLRLQLFGIS